MNCKWSQKKQLTHLYGIHAVVKRIIVMLNHVLTIGNAKVGKLEYDPISFDFVSYCRNSFAEFMLHQSNQVYGTTLVFSTIHQFIL